MIKSSPENAHFTTIHGKWNLKYDSDLKDLEKNYIPLDAHGEEIK